MEKSNMDELNFLWEKTGLHFSYDLQTITIARIHFTICKLRSNNLNPGIFFINLAKILIAHLTPNLGYLPKRYWWSKMLFELKFTKFVSFYKIRKITSFLPETRSNSKITLVKTICIGIYHGNNNGNHGYCG